MKYTVTEVEPLRSGDRRFKVHEAGQPEWMLTEVWFASYSWKKRGRAWCCGCSGVAAAMLGSCKHANAVKRLLNKPTGSDTP